MPKINYQGLTWEEWANAAALPFKGWAALYELHTPAMFPKERRAWREGEDPTEWRT